MFDILTTKLRPLETRESVLAITLGRVPFSTGDIVEVRFNYLVLGEFEVVSKLVVPIKNITEEHLSMMHPSYNSVGRLSGKLSSCYQSEIHGDTEITIVSAIIPNRNQYEVEEILEDVVPTVYTLEEFAYRNMKKRDKLEEA